MKKLALLLTTGMLLLHIPGHTQEFSPPDRGGPMLSPGSYSVFSHTASRLSNDLPLPAMSFSVNPLGLLQFGPMFQLETRVANKFYLVPHFRYGYIGALTWLDWEGFDEDTEMSPLNLGIGLGGRFINPVGEKNNAMYLGGIAEYSIGSAKYNVGEASATEEKFSGLNLFGNIGYRWRYATGMFINVGIYAGFAITLSDEERYIDSGELYDDYGGVFFGGGAEVSFGWEF